MKLLSSGSMLGQPLPPGVSGRDRSRYLLGRQLGGDDLGAEEADAVGHRAQADGVMPPPEVGVELRHVAHEPVVGPGSHDLVARGDERPADVVHEDAEAGRAASGVEGHGDDRVVDDVGKAVVEAGPPHLVLPVVGVAGHPHDPVGLGVEHLEEAGPTLDGEQLEVGPGLGVGAADRSAVGGAGGELLDRVDAVSQFTTPSMAPSASAQSIPGQCGRCSPCGTTVIVHGVPELTAERDRPRGGARRTSRYLSALHLWRGPTEGDDACSEATPGCSAQRQAQRRRQRDRPAAGSHGYCGRAMSSCGRDRCHSRRRPPVVLGSPINATW